MAVSYTHLTISAVPEGGKERQEYSMPSIDHEAEQHINAQEAEFGADGTRVFRDKIGRAHV